MLVYNAGVKIAIATLAMIHLDTLLWNSIGQLCSNIKSPIKVRIIYCMVHGCYLKVHLLCFRAYGHREIIYLLKVCRKHSKMIIVCC